MLSQHDCTLPQLRTFFGILRDSLLNFLNQLRITASHVGHPGEDGRCVRGINPCGIAAHCRDAIHHRLAAAA
jgi:hypothetical protein